MKIRGFTVSKIKHHGVNMTSVTNKYFTYFIDHEGMGFCQTKGSGTESSGS